MDGETERAGAIEAGGDTPPCGFGAEGEEAVKPIPALLPVEKRTVFPVTGTGDLGFVTEEIALKIGCEAGPIKLLNGVEGRSTGFGLAHIEARRLKHIVGMGYKDVVTYVKFVVSDFEMIVSQPGGRLLFIRKSDRYFHHVVCQWDEELKIWSTTTALPKPVFRDEKDVVWKKE
jgi:hypothetical protein